MTTLLALLVLVSTGVPASASNNRTDSPAVANSTNAVDVVRRERACTPHQHNAGLYPCSSRGYTEVPNTVWQDNTVEIYLDRNEISVIPANTFNGLTMLQRIDMRDNVITMVPLWMGATNPALVLLYLAENPLVCFNYSPSWAPGTAISTLCTSCTVGTPETITIDAVDYWQCSTCTSKNDDPSLSEVNDAMEVFCPDYATDVGVQGKPEYGDSAKMCRARDQKYETRLHQAMFHGMFGGASGSGRVCKAWCLYDVEEQNRHFRWDNKNGCWKTRKNRPCRDSTNQERGFAADIFDSFCD